MAAPLPWNLELSADQSRRLTSSLRTVGVVAPEGSAGHEAELGRGPWLSGHPGLGPATRDSPGRKSSAGLSD